MLRGTPLTGSISQGKKYDIYEGIGGSTAIEDLSLIDNIGDNIINATNKISEDLHYYSFAVSNSEIDTGDGDDQFNKKKY